MKRLYQYDEQKRHPHLLAEHYFNKLQPFLVYTGFQEGCPGPQNVMHSHTFVEIAFFIQGHGSVMIDGKRYPVKKKDIIVYNAGANHCEYSEEDNPLAFYFIAYDKLSIPNLPENQLLASDYESVYFTGEMFDTFKNLFSTVLDEIKRNRIYGYEIAQATAKIIIMELFRLVDLFYSTKELLRANRVLQTALEFIDENYAKPISLNEISSKCLVSKYYLSHLFSEQLGKSVGWFILNKRLFAAQHLLLTSQASIDKISQACGFGQGSYFCRLFKKETGMTPTQFREFNR